MILTEHPGGLRARSYNEHSVELEVNHLGHTLVLAVEMDVLRAIVAEHGTH